MSGHKVSAVTDILADSFHDLPAHICDAVVAGMTRIVQQDLVVEKMTHVVQELETSISTISAELHRDTEEVGGWAR